MEDQLGLREQRAGGVQVAMHTPPWESSFRSLVIACGHPIGPFGTSLASFGKRKETFFSPFSE